jgi:hypothetical protein
LKCVAPNARKRLVGLGGDFEKIIGDRHESNPKPSEDAPRHHRLDLEPHDELIREAADALRSVRDNMLGKGKLPSVPTLKKDGA